MGGRVTVTGTVIRTIQRRQFGSPSFAEKTTTFGLGLGGTGDPWGVTLLTPREDGDCRWYSTGAMFHRKAVEQRVDDLLCPGELGLVRDVDRVLTGTIDFDPQARLTNLPGGGDGGRNLMRAALDLRVYDFLARVRLEVFRNEGTPASLPASSRVRVSLVNHPGNTFPEYAVSSVVSTPETGCGTRVVISITKPGLIAPFAYVADGCPAPTPIPSNYCGLCVSFDVAFTITIDLTDDFQPCEPCDPVGAPMDCECVAPWVPPYTVGPGGQPTWGPLNLNVRLDGRAVSGGAPEFTWNANGSAVMTPISGSAPGGLLCGIPCCSIHRGIVAGRTNSAGSQDLDVEVLLGMTPGAISAIMVVVVRAVDGTGAEVADIKCCLADCKTVGFSGGSCSDPPTPHPAGYTVSSCTNGRAKGFSFDRSSSGGGATIDVTGSVRVNGLVRCTGGWVPGGPGGGDELRMAPPPGAGGVGLMAEAAGVGDVVAGQAARVGSGGCGGCMRETREGVRDVR